MPRARDAHRRPGRAALVGDRHPREVVVGDEVGVEAQLDVDVAREARRGVADGEAVGVVVQVVGAHDDRLVGVGEADREGVLVAAELVRIAGCPA